MSRGFLTEVPTGYGSSLPMNYDVSTPTTSAAAVWAWRLYPGRVFCAASRTMSWEKSNETPSSSPSGVKAVLSFSWKCRKQSSRLAILSGDDLESFIFLSFFSFYSISLSPSFLSRHFPGFIMRKEGVEELWNLRLEEKTNSLAHRWLSYGLKDYKNGYPGSRLWRVLKEYRFCFLAAGNFVRAPVVANW